LFLPRQPVVLFPFPVPCKSKSQSWANRKPSALRGFFHAHAHPTRRFRRSRGPCFAANSGAMELGSPSGGKVDLLLPSPNSNNPGNQRGAVKMPGMFPRSKTTNAGAPADQKRVHNPIFAARTREIQAASGLGRGLVPIATAFEWERMERFSPAEIPFDRLPGRPAKTSAGNATPRQESRKAESVRNVQGMKDPPKSVKTLLAPQNLGAEGF